MWGLSDLRLSGPIGQKGEKGGKWKERKEGKERREVLCRSCLWVLWLFGRTWFPSTAKVTLSGWASTLVLLLFRGRKLARTFGWLNFRRRAIYLRNNKSLCLQRLNLCKYLHTCIFKIVFEVNCTVFMRAAECVSMHFQLYKHLSVESKTYIWEYFSLII